MLGTILISTQIWQMIPSQEFSQQLITFYSAQNESARCQTAERNIAILMETQNLQQSLIQTNVQAINIARIHLAKNGHMLNGLVDAFKSIINTVYHENIAIDGLNVAQNFLLTLAKILPQTKSTM